MERAVGFEPTQCQIGSLVPLSAWRCPARLGLGYAQPAVKCLGPEYLRIIYGPAYLVPENLERLRAAWAPSDSSQAGNLPWTSKLLNVSSARNRFAIPMNSSSMHWRTRQRTSRSALIAPECVLYFDNGPMSRFRVPIRMGKGSLFLLVSRNDWLRT